MSLTEIFTNIANSIRAKTGKTDTITPSEMSAEIDSISGGGSTPTTDGINAMEYLSIIGGSYLFTSNNDITYFENKTNAASDSKICFESCTNLKTVTIKYDNGKSPDTDPIVKSCQSLDSLVISGITGFSYTGSYMLVYVCPELKTIAMPDLTTLPKAEAFLYETAISDINFPKISTINSSCTLVWNKTSTALRTITLGSVGNPVSGIVTTTKNLIKVPNESAVTVNIYVSDPSAMTGVTFGTNTQMALNWLQA